MNFIDEIALSVTFPKFVFGIDKNKSLLGCNFLSTGKEFAGPVLNDVIIFFRNDALLDNFLFRNIQVMALRQL